jgi:hypothetical protein
MSFEPPKYTLVFGKVSLGELAITTGTEPEDPLTYHRRHLAFPNETTSDQFFDEGQFESYRKLDELIGDDVLFRNEIIANIGNDSSGTAYVPNLFETLYDQYQKRCAEMNRESVGEQAKKSTVGGAP